jgi:hypothetical protein
MERFLSENDVSALEKEITNNTPIELGINMVETIIATRREAYLNGAAHSGDSDFRVALFRGALSAAYYQAEETAYLAVALSLSESRDERDAIYNAFLDDDRAFKRRGEGNAMDNFFTIQEQVNDALKQPVEELIASDDVIKRSAGLTARLKASPEIQAIRAAEVARNAQVK